MDIYYRSVQALCPDNKMRRVRARHYRYGGFAADTFYTVPAYVTIAKRNVRGYVTFDSDEGTLLFRAYDDCRPSNWN
jgi:hypothetical protein